MIAFTYERAQSPAQAASAVAARPGARRELLENYIKRLEKLETLAKGFEGVSKAFALQAGREIRIMVDAGKVGAWYTLNDGPLAEVLLARGTDTAALEATLAPCNGPAPQVWRQWISPGVVGPR